MAEKKNIKHNIYFSVCGEGYGHSSRVMAIANILKSKGVDVLIGCYGYVLERLSKSFDTVEIKKEFEMVGNNGSFDLKATILKSKKTAFFISKFISDEKKILEKFKATCVVSDGRNAAVFAAFKLGIPCIIISNQTSLLPFFNDSSFLMRLVGKPIEFTYKTSIVLAEEVLIPDFTPPDTVCINTLSKKPLVMKKQNFVGPIVSLDDNEKELPSDAKPPFVLTLLGGHSYRLPMFEGILKIASQFPNITFLIFTKFKSENIPKNVVVKEFVNDISSYMQHAKIIITQAGHSTCMEVMTLGKPSLIIPDKGQIEQENNALRMKELGVCETLNYDSLKPEIIFEKLTLVLNDDKYRNKAKEFSELSKKMNGKEKSADIILEVSERVQCY